MIDLLNDVKPAPNFNSWFNFVYKIWELYEIHQDISNK